jgi:hypothetical protein
MDAYTLDGAADGEVAIETTGVFTHAAHGAVANLPAAVISAHERIFTVPDTSSRVEISGTNDVTFNAFEPSPVCDPEIWECE